MKIPFKRKPSSWHEELSIASDIRDALRNTIYNEGNEHHTMINRVALGHLVLVDENYTRQRSNPMGPFEGHTVRVLPAPETPPADTATGNPA